MQARVFGLETEYAISFVPARESSVPDAETLFAVLLNLIDQSGNRGGLGFLPNGSRLYLDRHQIEWATPECRTALEAATYDAAAESILMQRRIEAQEMLARRGYEGRLLIVKNNVDGSGNTYGCHENYLTPRKTQWLSEDDQVRLMARGLIPFLVTRQVFAGAGRVGIGTSAESGTGFQLSQRADFLDEILSANTTHTRAIFSLSREGESLGGDENRRLHLILGDSNLSPWATRMKLGTTALVLRLIEELGLEDIPHLMDPLGSLKAISRDPQGSLAVPLRDGRQLRAIEIQRLYWQQAESHLSGRTSHEEKQVLEEWGRALDLLEREPRELIGKVDWVTKKIILDAFLQQNGTTWEKLTPTEALFFDVMRKDIEYHELSPSGLYQLLRSKIPPGPIDSRLLASARQEPPPFTRAWLRGVLIHHRREQLRRENWDSIRLHNDDYQLDDPLALDWPAKLEELIPDGIARERIRMAFRSSESRIRAWAVSKMFHMGLSSILEVWRIAVDVDESCEVRCAAMNVLAKDGSAVALQALQKLSMPEIDLAIRWYAEELLQPANSEENPERIPTVGGSRQSLVDDVLVEILDQSTERGSPSSADAIQEPQVERGRPAMNENDETLTPLVQLLD